MLASICRSLSAKSNQTASKSNGGRRRKHNRHHHGSYGISENGETPSNWHESETAENSVWRKHQRSWQNSGGIHVAMAAIIAGRKIKKISAPSAVA